MDLEGIPGLVEELNDEVSIANEEFVVGDVEEESEQLFLEDSATRSPVDLDLSVEDKEEEALLRNFFEGDPCCSLGPSKTPCWNHYGRESFKAARQDSLELDKPELDIAVLAQLRSSRSLIKESSHISLSYQFGGKPICRAAFLFINNIGIRKFKNLVAHYDQHGVSSRIHKNTKKRPYNRTEDETVESIKNFIIRFADNHALPLPGRLPSHKDYRVMLLPSDMSKSSVYRFYKRGCEADQVTCVSIRTFTNIWNQLCPFISSMKPATDLCFTCQTNANLLMKSANMPDLLKSQRLVEAQEHLDRARLSRKYYNDQCTKAKEALDHTPPTEAHYSFDYAQQVHYPFSAQQVGPIFFKTPRKCGIFGVACEATSMQVNYIIDEADVIGKGANATISMVHHYLQNHGHKVKVLHLHADNCVGQNKNNYVIQYLVWRTLANLNDEIELSFMLVGHTKFAPDRFFGLFKNLFRKSTVDTLADIQRVVEESSVSGKNKVQLTVCPTTGERHVHWIEWTKFLEDFFRPIPSITKYHHFKVKKSTPGVVYLKEFSDSTEENYIVFKRGINSLSLRGKKPPEIVPPGLDAKRQWYLYEEIRQFCSTNLAKDLTCPKPEVPKPGSEEQPRKRTKQSS